jgi:hypothetical protein
LTRLAAPSEALADPEGLFMKTMRVTEFLLLLALGCGGAATSASVAEPAPAVDERVLAEIEAEAGALLAELRVLEERYRAEFVCYRSSGPNANCMQPDPAPPWAPVVMPADGASEPWVTDSPAWRELGFRPSHALRVQLRIAAGPPGAEPVGGGPAGDGWFVAMARARIGAETHTWLARSWASGVEARIDP